MRLLLGLLLLSLPLASNSARAADAKPNIVIIFADDLGYGDLGCYGNPTIRTPNFDRMAAQGMRFTQFYSAACVCTPSRAGLLTGRLPVRSGMCSDSRRVLFPNSAGGLPKSEVTIAEALKEQGYATACVGKWHLGHLPEHLPMNHGFDQYFGIPYSNDMRPCPLMRGEKVLEEPADQTTLTRRYTEEALEFIKANQEQPFFLYFPHTFPHVPLFASEEFKGTSPRGLYGDVVEEMDWSTGRILDTLEELGLDENTFVFFTSDNGPWLIKRENGGTAGLLRDGKGSTWEGGMREPGIAWWPGKIKPGSVNLDVASTMDLFATCLALGGAELPDDRIIDGRDLSPTLLGTGELEERPYFYYRGETLYAVRVGPFKAHFITRPAYGGGKAEKHDPPLVYHLLHDPSERFDVAKQHPELVERVRKVVAEHEAKLEAPPSQLEKRIGGE